MALHRHILFLAVSTLGLGSLASAADLKNIRNYIEYSSTFASAGQPTREQLDDVKAAGYKRVIYIAFTNSGNAIADEDAVVKELGMDYVQIPVIWDAPTLKDFYSFAAAMQQDPGSKTLLHCQANFRASAFSMLYRVLYEDVPLVAAKADMNRIWQPNETWTNLILAVLEDNDVSADCEGCDWSVRE